MTSGVESVESQASKTAKPEAPGNRAGIHSQSTRIRVAMKPVSNEAMVRSGDADAPCAEKSRKWVLAATILGSSMAFIDGTVVNVALPALQSSLHATVVDVQWVIESYGLFLSALILVGGALGDY